MRFVRVASSAPLLSAALKFVQDPSKLDTILSDLDKVQATAYT